MLKHLWVLILAALAACCPHVKSPSIAQLEDATIAVRGAEGSLCAGVWVDKTHVLTAGHCVEEAGLTEFDRMSRELQELTAEEGDEEPPLPSPLGHNMGYETRDKKSTGDAKIVKYDHKDDLALLEVLTPPTHAIVSVREKPLELGEEVQLVGHPMASMFAYTRGVVSLLVEEIPCAPMGGICGPRVMFAIPAARGNSGGGVFDAHGQLIGIASLVANPRAGSGFMWAVGQDLIRGFLR
jgi:S1-C subfamily serine protease